MAYFPVSPAKSKRSLKKNVFFLVCDPDTDRSSIIDDRGVTVLDNGIELIDNLIPGKAYISYLTDNEYIITNALTRSKQAHCIYSDSILKVQRGKGEDMISINDITSFFDISLIDYSAERGLGSDPVSLVIALSWMWEDYSKRFYEAFSVYPSLSPGSSAIKAWRHTITEPVFPRGKPITSLLYRSIGAPLIYWKPGYYENCYMYDINASYLHAMRSLRYPVTLTGFLDRKPPEGSKWIATVKINYSGKHAIPIKGSRVVFPTQITGGTVTINYIDYQLAEMRGTIEVLAWLEGVYWTNEEEEYIFKDFVDLAEAAALSDPMSKKMIKITSRSLHSKFAQRRTYEDNHVRFSEPSNRTVDIMMINEEIATVDKVKSVRGFRNYIRPDYESLTLSFARAYLMMHMDNNTIYSDTDCIISTVERDDLPIGGEFGKWKEEARGNTWIIGPRFYQIGEKVRASGIIADREIVGKAIRVATHKGFASIRNKKEVGSKVIYKIFRINFPLSRMIVRRLYVKQSPERLEQMKPYKRFLGCVKRTTTL